MAIVRYTASADNTITNAFDESLVSTLRATGSNMGKSDVLEVFGLYGQDSGSIGLSSEVSRFLIQFDTTSISSDRVASKIPASGSVNFFLCLYNAAHSKTLPEDYKLTVARVTNSWEEGYGLDMENYKDKTYDGVGSNWVRGNGTDAQATGRVTVLNEGFIETGDTITLRATDGTQVVATATATTTTSTAATTAVQFAHNGVGTTGQAALIAQAINHSSFFSATADGANVNITQSVAGYGGNSTITCVDGGGAGPWFSKTDFTGGSGKWATVGGDFVTGSNSGMDFVDVSFPEGDEDLKVDITSIVEGWITTGNTNYGLMIKLTSSQEPYFTGTTSATGSKNITGAKRSYYTKKFFARGTEYFFKRPVIEARFDDSTKDDRGNIVLSSSLAPAADNLNTIYMYNYVRGKLTDIKGLTTQKPTASFYYSSASVPEGPPRTYIANNTSVTSAKGTRVSKGVYSVSFAIKADQFPAGYPYLVDVWSYGGEEVHTGSAMLPKVHELSNANPNTQYVVSVSNMREYYNNAETARFRVYMRKKGWSPTVHTIASNKVETLTVPSASYEIYRVVDEVTVVPYGTGSTRHTMMSHDVSGNYFDLDMSLLEPGYSYGIRVSIYEDSIGSYREQPYTFKFRVNDYEY